MTHWPLEFFLFVLWTAPAPASVVSVTHAFSLREAEASMHHKRMGVSAMLLGMTFSTSNSFERVFSEKLEKQLLKHAGCWVAVFDDTIVAVGTTPTETLGSATRLGHPRVLLHYVQCSGEALMLCA